MFVGVPVAAGKAIVVATPDLHEADAALEEAAGSKALSSKGVTLFFGVDGLRPLPAAVVDAVAFPDGWGLLGEVERLRCGQLHLRRQFIAADARLEPGIRLPGCGVAAVEAVEQVEAGAFTLGGDEIVRGREKVRNGRLGSG